MPLGEATLLLRSALQRIDAQLADDRRFLTGDAARICDFSVYHPLWFIGRAGPMAEIFQPYPHLRGWMGRMAAIGHGAPSEMSSGDALGVARAAAPAMPLSTWRREADGAAWEG